MGTFVTIYLFLVAFTSPTFIGILLLILIGILASVLFKVVNKNKQPDQINIELTPVDYNPTIMARLSEQKIADEINKCQGENCTTTAENQDHSLECLTEYELTHLNAARADSALVEAKTLISELIDALETEIPEKNCTCFKTPPCSNCVEYSLTYEIVKGAKEFLKSNS